MNKKEFLDILRQSLEGEVDNNTIEKNIKFYSDYISSYRDKSEEEVIESIGDPRLIAKTIIETEKMSNKTDNNSQRNNGYEEYEKDKDHRNTRSKEVFPGLKWYYKAAIFVVLFLLIYLLIKIGWFFIRLLSIFFVPIAVIVILLIMFRKR